jgi:hypothetical protein
VLLVAAKPIMLEQDNYEQLQPFAKHLEKQAIHLAGPTINYG